MSRRRGVRQTPSPFRWPFCGLYGKATKEHVVPLWLEREVNSAAGWRAGDPEGKSRPLRRYETVKLCPACQTWLNVRFEQPARPVLLALMYAETCAVSAADLELVSAYVTKTIMLIQLYSGHTPSSSFTESERRPGGVITTADSLSRWAKVYLDNPLEPKDLPDLLMRTQPLTPIFAASLIPPVQ